MFRVRVVPLGLLTGGVLAVAVNSAGAAMRAPYTLYGAAVPPTIRTGPRIATEVGVRFRVRVAGEITGIRFYKRTDNRGPHTAGLWDARGRLLAHLTFRHETRAGWQHARFAHPVGVRPGVTYVAAYHAPHGGYSLSRPRPHAAGSPGPLIPLDGAHGVYRRGAGARLPRRVSRAAGFWVDVTFVRDAHGTSAGSGTKPSQPTGAPAGTGTTSTTGGPAGTGTTSTTGCFARPGTCGFPDPQYGWTSAAAWQPGGGGVGPTEGRGSLPCSALPRSTSITTTGDGQVISNLNVSGTIQVVNRNVTIDNVCVTNDGGGALGSDAIKVLAGGLTIENSTVAGADDSTGSVEQAVTNFGGGTVTMSHDYVHACGECLNTGSWNVSDSYILDDGMYGTDDHLEAIYVEGSGDVVRVTHSTVLSPPGWNGSGSPQGGQAGLFFGDTNSGRGGACSTRWSLTGNLLAGDGFLLYECGNSASVGTAALTFTGNRIATCSGPTLIDSQGYSECSDIPAQTGAGSNRAGDGFGYFPDGGLKGTDLATYCTAGTTDWTANVNETTGAPVVC